MTSTADHDATPATDRDDRPSLLVADDDAVTRAVLTAQLGREFRVVAAAGDATQAIACAELHKPDVALIDVEMPDGGAREAVPGIARVSPTTRMVILSGDESRRSVLELLEAGAVAYLRKGISGTELARTLHEALAVEAGQASQQAQG